MLPQLLWVSIGASLQLRTFGTGKSAFVLTSNEKTVFEYKATTAAVMTHFWMVSSYDPQERRALPIPRPFADVVWIM